MNLSLATLLARPSLVVHDVVRDYQGQSGFDKTFDIQVKFIEPGWSDLVCSVAWSEDKKLIPGSNAIKTTVSQADVALYNAGDGWAKLTEIDGFAGTQVKWSERIIQFKKRFLLEMPLAFILKKIPLLDEIDISRTYRAEIHGAIDVKTFERSVEMVYL